jgi:hypothetical protein
MIDVIPALELFEICADEMAEQDSSDACELSPLGRRRPSLTARELAKQQVHIAHLARFPLRGPLLLNPTTGEPTMTLGAVIVFRTADRFGRADASTRRILDAVYRAVQRYMEIIPSSLQDGVDKTAVQALLADPELESRFSYRRPRSDVL